MWVGAALSASVAVTAAEDPAAGYVAVWASPAYTALVLLCLSGIPTAEGENWARFQKTTQQAEELKNYLLCTSPLIPLPRTIYRRTPLMIKRVVLFEWPLYEPPAADLALEYVPVQSSTPQSSPQHQPMGEEGEEESDGDSSIGETVG